MKTIKGIIKPSELGEFTKHKDWINVLVTTLLFASATGLILLAQNSHWSVYVMCFIAMGAIQHTIATFVHEAGHGHFLSNRKLNERLGQLLFSAPLLSFLEDYRYFHWEHHRFTGKPDKDPELGMYQAMKIKNTRYTKRELISVFLNDFTGVSYARGMGYLMKYMNEKKAAGLIPKPGAWELFTLAIWFIAVPAIMWKTGNLQAYLIVWVLPLVTLTPTLLRWHGFGEHIRSKDGDLAQNTLTHRFGLFATLFLYPINSSFHLEHHMYPQLPWYSLRTFRKWAENNQAYKEAANQHEVDSFILGKNSVIKKTFLSA